MSRLEINVDNMKRNLEKMGGLVCSEHIMLTLIGKGLTREEAYKIVQRNAAKTWDGADFKSALMSDEDVSSRLKEDDLDECFSYDRHVRNVDVIFERLGL
jgi:adenylosuccinate lyase